MGAPLPSRFVVFERVMRDTTKAEVMKHTDWRRVDLRSIKLMSGEDSLFKRYLLEFSVEHKDKVLNETFWPRGVRVRPFRGKGNEWRDREQAEQPAESEQQTEDSVEQNTTPPQSS